jgi:hypothetical protein
MGLCENMIKDSKKGIEGVGKVQNASEMKNKNEYFVFLIIMLIIHIAFKTNVMKMK